MIESSTEICTRGFYTFLPCLPVMRPAGPPRGEYMKPPLFPWDGSGHITCSEQWHVSGCDRGHISRITACFHQQSCFSLRCDNTMFLNLLLKNSIAIIWSPATVTKSTIQQKVWIDSSQKNMHRVLTHLKRCSTSLLLEMQIKTSLRYHFSTTSLETIKKSDDIFH